MLLPDEFPDHMTLKEARDKMRPLVYEDGHHCPVCRQYARVYRRKIHASMAIMLASMYRRGKLDWVYLPEIPQRSRDGTGLQWWGLIQEERALRKDGGRAGYWRVSLLGESWLRKRIAVPRYVLIYDGRFLGYLDESDKVTISDALGDKFSYADLMAGL